MNVAKPQLEIAKPPAPSRRRWVPSVVFTIVFLLILTFISDWIHRVIWRWLSRL